MSKYILSKIKNKSILMQEYAHRTAFYASFLHRDNMLCILCNAGQHFTHLMCYRTAFLHISRPLGQHFTHLTCPVLCQHFMHLTPPGTAIYATRAPWDSILHISHTHTHMQWGKQTALIYSPDEDKTEEHPLISVQNNTVQSWMWAWTLCFIHIADLRTLYRGIKHASRIQHKSKLENGPLMDRHLSPPKGSPPRSICPILPPLVRKPVQFGLPLPCGKRHSKDSPVWLPDGAMANRLPPHRQKMPQDASATWGFGLSAKWPPVPGTILHKTFITLNLQLPSKHTFSSWLILDNILVQICITTSFIV